MAQICFQGDGWDRHAHLARDEDPAPGFGINTERLAEAFRDRAGEMSHCAYHKDAPFFYEPSFGTDVGLKYCRLAPATGNAVLSFGLDRAALVAEILSRFFTHSGAYFIGQSGKCLTSGRAAAFERAVVGIKR